MDPLHHKSFAIFCGWDFNAPSAEKEVIERTIIASKNIDVTCYVANNKGFIYDLSGAKAVLTSQTVEDLELDFVIHTHYSSTKIHDVFSFYALWIPSIYTTHWGDFKAYESIANHDDYLVNSGQNILEYVKHIYHDLDRTDTFFDFLSYTPSMPASSFYTPEVKKQYRLFYVGMGWEKLINQPSRHSELLIQLDKTDYMDFYGPKQIEGFYPWKGYDSYRGEVPFDGITILEKAHKSGIVLALSSMEHQRTDVLTNRIHEAIAAGCMVIASRHSLLEKLFGDNIFYVDNYNDANETFNQIEECVKWINANQDSVHEKIQITQKIYKEHLALENVITNICQNVNQRKLLVQNKFFSQNNEDTIDIIVPYYHFDSSYLDLIISNIQKQEYSNVNVIFIIDNSLADDLSNKLIQNNISFPYTIIKTRIFTKHKDNTFIKVKSFGELVFKATPHLTNNYTLILSPYATIFKDHLSRLKRKLEDSDAIVSVSESVLMFNETHAEEFHNNPYEMYTTLISANTIRARKNIANVLFKRNELNSILTELIFNFNETFLFHFIILDAILKGKLEFINKITSKYRLLVSKDTDNPADQSALNYQISSIASYDEQARFIYNIYKVRLEQKLGKINFSTNNSILYTLDNAYLKYKNIRKTRDLVQLFKIAIFHPITFIKKVKRVLSK